MQTLLGDVAERIWAILRLKHRVGKSSRVKSRRPTYTDSDVEFTAVAENRSMEKQKKIEAQSR